MILKRLLEELDAFYPPLANSDKFPVEGLQGLERVRVRHGDYGISMLSIDRLGGDDLEDASSMGWRCLRPWILPMRMCWATAARRKMQE